MPIEMTGREFVQDVLGRCHEKERIEARLGKDIHDVFNSGPALAKLQQVAEVLLDAMANGTFISVQAAIGEESELRLWGKLQKIWNQASKEVTREQNVAGRSSPADSHLARARSDGWPLEPQLKEFARDPAGFTGKGGVKKQGSKRLISGTNLSIINRLFGLSWGCDISGTTCDELFAMERRSGRLVAPLLQLATSRSPSSRQITDSDCGQPWLYSGRRNRHLADLLAPMCRFRP